MDEGIIGVVKEGFAQGFAIGVGIVAAFIVFALVIIYVLP